MEKKLPVRKRTRTTFSSQLHTMQARGTDLPSFTVIPNDSTNPTGARQFSLEKLHNALVTLPVSRWTLRFNPRVT